MKKNIISLFAIVILFSTLSSCMTTKTQVGTYTEKVGNEYTYAKGKQMWLFWGLLPLGRTSVNTPNDGNCEVITKTNFGDVLINTLTLGVVKSYTIKVKAKRNE